MLRNSEKIQILLDQTVLERFRVVFKIRLLIFNNNLLLELMGDEIQYILKHLLITNQDWTVMIWSQTRSSRLAHSSQHPHLSSSPPGQPSKSMNQSPSAGRNKCSVSDPGPFVWIGLFFPSPDPDGDKIWILILTVRNLKKLNFFFFPEGGPPFLPLDFYSISQWPWSALL